MYIVLYIHYFRKQIIVVWSSICENVFIATVQHTQVWGKVWPRAEGLVVKHSTITELFWYLCDLLYKASALCNYQLQLIPKEKGNSTRTCSSCIGFSNVNELVCSSCGTIKTQRMPDQRSEWKSHLFAVISYFCTLVLLHEFSSSSLVFYNLSYSIHKLIWP